jgi:ABC-type transport system involved in multi-copper enzyme maturation permease subunit
MTAIARRPGVPGGRPGFARAAFGRARSGLAGFGLAGFGRVLRAEWTKFRTVRGWVIGMIVAALVTLLLGLATAAGGVGSCNVAGCAAPVGPGGEIVSDSFYFVHRALAGNGSITVRVTSLTGLIPAPSGPGPAAGMRPGLAPWAKAGIIIEQSARQGSAYAAVMVTGSHGVRMQYDYTQDIAGRPGGVSAASPRWLRLTRSGDAITGAESADGRHWTPIGTATLAGLPGTVQAGLFVTSPQYVQQAGAGTTGGPTQATAAFDHASLRGTWPGRRWAGESLGGPGNAPPGQRGGFQRAGGRFTVTGSGDIAPAVAGLSNTIADPLIATFAGLVVVGVVAAMFITAEYRRGLIRTTLTASPRRGQVLAAKAVVIGAVTFTAGLAAAAVVVALGQRIMRGNGVYVYPVTLLTGLRVVAGTAALLAVSAVLALAIGTAVRRSVMAVTAVIVVIVVPYLLAVSAVLPDSATEWLLRVSPAAAFAVQQTMPQYPQVSNVYLPSDGFYPLAPWAGLAVLCAWAAAALGLAFFLLRRRDQ